jgi:RHH-type proline utilization regulon transcriptional repressor/proline dehydrogenase/delta 1-pyrroline-5-carboxylate dehydrogenase
MQQVRGQTNSFRYRKVGNYTIRVCPEDSVSDILLRLFAGLIAGNKIFISIPMQMQQSRIASFLKSRYLETIRNNFTLNFEDEEELCKKILTKSMERLSYTHPNKIPCNIYKAAIQVNLPIFKHKPIEEGRFLMLEQYFEQSISHTYHRYGNLGFKQFEIESSSKQAITNNVPIPVPL